MNVSGGTASSNLGVRRVVLITNPQLHPFSNAAGAPNNYYCLALDMKGFQVEIDLQAMPPGVSIDQLQINQVWWVEKRTSLYRLYLYGGVMDQSTRQINSTASLPTPTVSGNYLPISGGTISGNLTVTGTTTLQGGLYVTSPVVGGVTATSGQSMVYNGTQWAPATISGGTASGNYLPISGGTISGNLTVASDLTVSGGGTVGGNLVVSGSLTVTGAVTATGIQISESQVTGLTTDLTNISGSLSTLSGNLSTLSGQYVSTSGSLTTLSGQFVNLSGSYSTTSGIVTSHTNSIALISGNLNTLSGQFVTLSGQYNTTSGIVTTATGNIASLSGSLATLSGQFVTLSGAYNTTSGIVTSHTSSIALISGNLNTVSGVAYAALPSSGGTISGNLVITSGLTVSGNITSSGTFSLGQSSSSNIVPFGQYFAPISYGQGYTLIYSTGGNFFQSTAPGIAFSTLALANTSATVGGNFIVTSGLTVTGTSTHIGAATFSGGVTISGGANIIGSTLSMGDSSHGASGIVFNFPGFSPQTLQATPAGAYTHTLPLSTGTLLNTAGGQTIGGTLTVSSGLTVNGVLSVASGATVTGTLSVTSGISVSGNAVTISGNGTTGYVTVGGVGGTVNAYQHTGNSASFSASISTNTLTVTGTATVGGFNNLGNETISGNLTVTGTSTLIGAIINPILQGAYEIVSVISGTALSGATTPASLNSANSSFYYYQSNPTANFTVAITGAPTVSGRSATYALLVNNGATGYYPVNVTVNGNGNSTSGTAMPANGTTASGITTYYQGGSPWTSSDTSQLDSYTFTVICTATGTPNSYTLLAGQTKF